MGMPGPVITPREHEVLLRLANIAIMHVPDESAAAIKECGMSFAAFKGLAVRLAAAAIEGKGP